MYFNFTLLCKEMITIQYTFQNNNNKLKCKMVTHIWSLCDLDRFWSRMWSGHVFIKFTPLRNQAHLSSSNSDTVLHFHIHLFTPFGGPAVTRLIFLWHFGLIFISFLHLYTIALAFCEGQCGFQTLHHSIKMERREGAQGRGAQGNCKCLQREAVLLG